MSRMIGKLALPGVVIVLIILGVNAYFGYRNTERLNNKERWVRHTHAVLFQVEQVRSLLNATEAAQRTYLLTGSSAHRTAYDETRTKLLASIDTLVGMTGDNFEQTARGQVVQRIADEHLKVLDEGVRLRQ